jgi:tetratricopeptide (TPR) repeat protein
LAACHAAPREEPRSPDFAPASAVPDVTEAHAQSDAGEVTSLFGAPLPEAPMSPDVRADREAELAEARAVYDASPLDADAIVWLGRRTAYLGRYAEAIAIYTKGLKIHPDDPQLLRHRGHRYITARRFSDAVADLERAATLVAGMPDTIENDGQPNPAGVPTGTLHTNIHYHRGLAHYLAGALEQARAAYEACLAASTTDDMRVAASYWLYITLRRLGREDEARRVLEPVGDEMTLYENFSYHHLLMSYRGEADPKSSLVSPDASDIDRATMGYGEGSRLLWQGHTAEALDVWRSVLQTPQWAAFGYIAAEADLHRHTVGR